MKHAIVLLVLLLTAPVSAFGDPLSLVDRMVYQIASSVNADSIKQDREYVGVIIQMSDGTLINSSGSGGSGQKEIAFTYVRPKDAKTVAIWHTHGARNKYTRYFSRADTTTANRANVPMYMMDSTGTLRVYNPGDPTVTSYYAKRKNISRFVALGKKIPIDAEYMAKQDG